MKYILKSIIFSTCLFVASNVFAFSGGQGGGSGGGGGGVSSVTASTPLASSGGSTPNITVNSAIPVTLGGLNTTTAPSAAQLLVAQSSTAYAPESVSGAGDCSASLAITGVITISCSKVNGVAYSASPSTNTVPVVTSTNTTTYETVPVLAGGTGGTSASTARSNLSAAASGANGDITSLTALTTPLSVSQGGTGTATPALVAGTNVTITGSWPDQTINSSGGGGGVSSVTGTSPIASSGGSTPNITVNSAIPVTLGGLNTTTAPSAAQLLVAQSSTAYAPESVSGAGDCSASLAITGVITISCSKVNGVAYSASPSTNTVPVVTSTNTTTYETVPVLAGGTNSTTAPSSGQLLVAQSSTAYAPETISGDTTITSSGVTTTSNLHFGLSNSVALPSTAPTSGGIPYFSSSSSIASSTALTANLPIIGGGAGVAPSSGTRSGNTTEYATASGTLTSGDCAKFDVNGNVIDNGSACGSGGGGISPPAGQIGGSTGTPLLRWNPVSVITTSVSPAVLGTWYKCNGTSIVITLPALATTGESIGVSNIGTAPCTITANTGDFIGVTSNTSFIVNSGFSVNLTDTVATTNLWVTDPSILTTYNTVPASVTNNVGFNSTDGANAVSAYGIYNSDPRVISHCNINITTADTTGTVYSYGFYNNGSLLTQCAPITYATIGVKSCTMTNTPVFLPRGELTLGETANGASAISSPGQGSSALALFYNGNLTTSTGGNMPSTITTPAISPTNTSFNQFYCY